jgi:hypothetical protein
MAASTWTRWMARTCQTFSWHRTIAEGVMCTGTSQCGILSRTLISSQLTIRPQNALASLKSNRTNCVAEVRLRCWRTLRLRLLTLKGLQCCRNRSSPFHDEFRSILFSLCRLYLRSGRSFVAAAAAAAAATVSQVLPVVASLTLSCERSHASRLCGNVGNARYGPP